MGIITISNLNSGINAKSDPTALSDDQVQDCVGFDLTTEGSLQSAGGLAVSDINTLLPASGIQCLQILFISSTKYVLATTITGLYANGALVQAGFSGRFKGVNYGNNIYLVNGSQAIRFDGTTCYKWGIDAPTSVPTITAGTHLSNSIDTFESLTTWIANKVDCTIATEGTIKKVGTYSMKVAVALSTIGYSYVPFTKDLTKFSTGALSSEKDYIKLWVYIDILENLDSIGLYFDIGDGTFLSDYLSFTIASPSMGDGLQILGVGATADVTTEDTTQTEAATPLSSQDQAYYDAGLYGLMSVSLSEQAASTQITKTITKNTTKTVIDPILRDQIMSFWSASNLFKVEAGVWLDIRIPKNRFIQNGDMTKGWNTITKLKLEVKATDKGAVNVYIDQMELVGGSDFVGKYYFGYAYARRDADNNILHESSSARASGQVLFSGPVKFDREPLVYAARPISTDPQVNAGILYGIGGSLSDFWVITQINDNTTVTDTLTDIGEDKAERIFYSKNSEPAPAGTSLVAHQNKIWMVGGADYPNLLRSSDILGDGTLAPEAWPTRNAYELEGNIGSLSDIRLVNQMPVVKGSAGEWAIQVLDPTDSLQVKAKRVSPMGLIGPDAVVDFETSNIYPSHGGFVESNGGSAQFVMPELQPLIDDNMLTAKGINAGLVSYFSYRSLLTGTRTAKVDLFKGKPRFANLNDFLLDWLAVDVDTNRVYAVKNGGVFLLDSGYTDESTVSKELNALLKSKAYQLGSLIAWNRIELIHNTNGQWFILDVYIDEVLRSSTPFKSSTKTVESFRDFGPASGYSFQFTIHGVYTKRCDFYLPIRIYYGGK